MTYWHEYNPWKDKVIYVTMSEWLDCLELQEQRISYVQQMERLPFHDLYILPNGTGDNPSMGMRYGRNGPEYLSPMGDKVKIQKLIEKYRECGDSTTD